jgi:hypothetical protein
MSCNKTECNICLRLLHNGRYDQMALRVRREEVASTLEVADAGGVAHSVVKYRRSV